MKQDTAAEVDPTWSGLLPTTRFLPRALRGWRGRSNLLGRHFRRWSGNPPQVFKSTSRTQSIEPCPDFAIEAVRFSCWRRCFWLWCRIFCGRNSWSLGASRRRHLCYVGILLGSGLSNDRSFTFVRSLFGRGGGWSLAWVVSEAAGCALYAAT